MLPSVSSTSQVQKEETKAVGLLIWNQLRENCNLSALDQPADVGQSKTVMKT